MVLDFLKKYAFVVSSVYIIGVVLSVFMNGYKSIYTIIFLIAAIFTLLLNVVEHTFFSKDKRISAKSEWSILGAGILSVIFFLLSFIKENSEVYTFFLLNTSIVFLIDIWYVKLYDLNGDF